MSCTVEEVKKDHWEGDVRGEGELTYNVSIVLAGGLCCWHVCYAG